MKWFGYLIRLAMIALINQRAFLASPKPGSPGNGSFGPKKSAASGPIAAPLIGRAAAVLGSSAGCDDAREGV